MKKKGEKMKLRKDLYYYCAKDPNVPIEKIRSHCAPKGCSNLKSEARRKPREKRGNKVSLKRRATSYIKI